MTSSSSVPLERGLDTMLLVYSLLQSHPAAVPCAQFIQSQTGWFTSVLALFEAKAILTKVYDVDPVLSEQRLAMVACGPLVLLDLDALQVGNALKLSNTLGLDFNDIVLLELASRHGAKWLATEDQKLCQQCAAHGIAAISPFDAVLRQQVAAWEKAHLPPKGLPRVLRQIHQWLDKTHPAAANDFWSRTSGGSHLP